MFYTDLIDETPVTMTAKQLLLAIREASLAAREQAFNEAATLTEQVDTLRLAGTQLRHGANRAAADRDDLQQQINATMGAVR
jgi:hypothetical protein